MQDTRIQELYKEYIEMLKSGASEHVALAHFDYVHPITKARLLKVIREYQSKLRLAK